MIKKYVFVAVAALLVAVAVVIPTSSYAVLGDVTVVRTTTCTGSQCVQVEIIYMETITGLVIMSMTTKTYDRNTTTKER